MSDIYLCGHGGWNPSTAKPFATVPKGTQVHLYTPGGALLLVSTAVQILNGGGPTAEVHQAFATLPNMTLHAFSAAEQTDFADVLMLEATRGGKRAILVRQDTDLATLVMDFQGNNLHWIACQAREMRRGGRPEDFEVARV